MVIQVGSNEDKVFQDPWQQTDYFPSSVYVVKKPEFVAIAEAVSDEYILKAKKKDEIDEIYPVVMTENMFADPRMKGLAEYIGATAWNILESQGYDMEGVSVYFTEMWCQEHHKHSLMEQHIHGFGSQLVGFYFLDCPPDSSRLVFHDPRSGKVQVGMRESNLNQVTFASNAVNYAPEPGMLIFANSWLPHSFGRHVSKKPLKFIHFNISISEKSVHAPKQSAEII